MYFLHFKKAQRIPSQVTDLSLSKIVRSGAALWVNWTTPQGNMAIYQYQGQYRINGTTIWGNQFVVSAPLTSAILTNLNADTEYSVRVRAVSAVGNGMWSAVQTERTYRCEIMIINYLC